MKNRSRARFRLHPMRVVIAIGSLFNCGSRLHSAVRPQPVGVIRRPQPHSGLTLRRLGKTVYLFSSDGKRLSLLENGEWAPGPKFHRETNISLPGRFQVTITDASSEFIVRRGAKIVRRVSLNAYRDAWLKMDGLWGGHVEANGMRSANTKGLDVFLEEPCRHDSTVLAILNFQAFWESDQAIAAQFLVRIRVSPRITIEPVRFLTTPAVSLRRTPRRLFGYHGKLLLFDHARLLDIPTDKGPLQNFALLPAGLAPFGILNQRWLILEKYEFGKDPLWILDLQSKLKPIPIKLVWENDVYVQDGSPIYLPPRGNQFLVTPQASTTYLVSLPRRSVVPLANPNGFGGGCIWNGVVVLKGTKVILCYKALTGHLMAALPL